MVHILRNVLVNPIKKSSTTHWMNHISKVNDLKNSWIISNFREVENRFLIQIRLYIRELEQAIHNWHITQTCGKPFGGSRFSETWLKAKSWVLHSMVMGSLQHGSFGLAILLDTFVAWDLAFLGLFRLHELRNLHTFVFFSRLDSQLSPDYKEFNPIYEILSCIPGIWINAKGRNDWGESWLFLLPLHLHQSEPCCCLVQTGEISKDIFSFAASPTSPPQQTETSFMSSGASSLQGGNVWLVSMITILSLLFFFFSELVVIPGPVLT